MDDVLMTTSENSVKESVDSVAIVIDDHCAIPRIATVNLRQIHLMIH